jgi:3-methyl-2-oxobutanoate hydroxymethyltransferase
MKKLSIQDLIKKKHTREIVTWLTCYDYSFASALSATSLDLILVGDSGGMVQLGYENTNPVTMEEMLFFSRAVRKGAPNKFLVGDMPKGSYEISCEQAVRNAMRFIKDANCDAIKLEGGTTVANQVKALTDSGICVFGHVGLTPQTSDLFGGYRVVGKNEKELAKIEEDIKALEFSGAKFILVEATPDGVAAAFSKKFETPIYGIGAGREIDGQLLILHDLLGLYPDFRPKFANCLIPSVISDFTNLINSQLDLINFGRDTKRDGFWELTRQVVELYCSKVRQGLYPAENEVYKFNF